MYVGLNMDLMLFRFMQSHLLQQFSIALSQKEWSESVQLRLRYVKLQEHWITFLSVKFRQTIMSE